DREHPLSQRQQGWMMQVQQAGWHLLEMINDTLDLSRIESGAIKLTVESLSLPDLLAWALAMVHNDAEQRGLSVTRALHPDAALVLADATRLKQVLTNLLSNAVKYNIEHGRIHIATRVLGPDYLELAVTDTGLGMSEQQLAAMFEPFNRLGREHSATEGTGIGLVICKRLVELMGGTLKVRSTKDEGSSFIVTLPRAVEPSGVRPVRDTAPGLPPEYRKRMVHYIEDNETNAEVMRGILAQRPQVELLVSMTGQAGIAAARAHPPHVILLDMHLPDMNGMDVLNQLRKHHETADTPVVVVSADALPLHMEAAYQQGVYRYLTKPVNVPELLCVLDELLDVMETRFG
ncbi:MAG: response regulator, partial [Aquabacterium sp.]|uniref:ATP-binding response regulator n=1 Tax=Aquabacterium sp. TaxID=1872578 RepID=UPI0011F5029F